MQIHRQNLKWAGRMMLILLFIVAADALVVFFVHKPFPWVLLIPALGPVLISAFVVLPMLRAEKAKAANA